MRRIFLSLVVLMLFGLISFKASFAAAITPTPMPRFATCDACGLCIVGGVCSVNLTPTPGQQSQVPGDWKNCVKCLYPDLYPQASNPNPSRCDTLLIDATTNLPKNPTTAGRQFTMLGCIKSGTSLGFNNQTGASSFVQKLLDVIFSLAGSIAFLYLMYGGFIVLTSQADPERLNYGKRLIYGAITGLIITISSVFIVNLIGSGILHIPGFTGAV